jgi:phage terminase large subunit GpA-like protein
VIDTSLLLQPADVLARYPALAARVLPPRPRLTLSEWSDTYRQLSRSASAEPGQWRTSRAAFQRGIMDAISDPMVEEVVVMKPAQVGYTEMLGNALGYFAAQDPAPMLLVQPTVEMGRAWSVDRLRPMLEEMPVLAELWQTSGRRTSDDTLLHKVFASGARLTITGANSAASLASRPIRILFFDEIDRFPASAGDEGNPIALATARTTTFANRKIVKGSTPTLKGMSNIEAEYAGSSMGRYHVPCPTCQVQQVPTWAKLSLDDLTLACESCGVAIPETAKDWMIARGEWVHAHPERRKRGFWLNALVSPWVPWATLRDEWREAQQRTELLQTFINLRLAEAWEESGGIAPGALEQRREAYEPADVAASRMVTAGVDVQESPARLEVSLFAWGPGEESWRLGHEVIYGDPTAPEVWAELDALRAQWRVYATAVDSGFHTQRVYEYVRPRLGQRVYAVKGSSTAGAPFLPRKPSKANKAHVPVHVIGTNAGKDIWYGRLRQRVPGPGYVHFDMGAGADYFEQLTSERRVRTMTGGKWASRYEVLPNRRNEALDCAVYALAALYLADPQRRRLATPITPPVTTEAVARETEPAPVERVTVERLMKPPASPSRRFQPGRFGR